MSTTSRKKRKQESTTTVKFNVGGKVYEVSKSLLVKSFPNTLLAEKALDSKTSCPIFIDRDPDRFAFVLDYMRDNGTVYLPETVPKSALIAELEYFGFEGIDETKIVCDKQSQRNCMARSHEIAETAKQRIERMEWELFVEKVALKCLEARVKNSDEHNDISVKFAMDDLVITQDYFRKKYYKVSEDPHFLELCDHFALHVDPNYNDYDYSTKSAELRLNGRKRREKEEEKQTKNTA